MTLLQDGLIAFLSAVGVTTLVWIVAGAFFRAGRPVIPAFYIKSAEFFHKTLYIYLCSWYDRHKREYTYIQGERG